MSFNLQWHGDINKKLQNDTHKKQIIVDSECLRYMDPYIPYKTGALAKSAVIGTVIGSGEIIQRMPYARYQYYGEVYGPNIPLTAGGELIGFYSPSSKTPTGRPLQYDTTKHPQAGKLWFERMKADHLDDIKRKAGAK